MEDDMQFILNDEEKTTYFCGTKSKSRNLSKYNEQEYLVTRINENSTFSLDQIESITIPSSVVKFEDGWCVNVEKLIKFEVDPNNKHFINYKDDFILGKTDENNDIFDVIIFARRDLEQATIPAFIKKINSYSFSKCNKLQSIEIPSNSELQIIGEGAFYFCISLRSLEFPDNIQIQEFENNSFGDSSIENIKIPDSVTRIGSGAFIWCKKLKQVEFTKNSKLKIIEQKAFMYSNVNKICFPSSLIEIDECAFAMNSNLKNIEFPSDSQTRIIKNNAFGWTGIESIILPSHLTILDNLFTESKKLKSIKFQENSEIQEIKSLALNFESIESITIPSSVVKFEDGWCVNVEKLIKFEVDPNNKHFINYKDDFILGKTDENNDIFDVIIFARRDLEQATIPTFIKKINSYSFSKCNKLQSIEIPCHVTTLDTLAFGSCINLKNVYFEDNSELNVFNLDAFDGTLIENLTIPEKVVDVLDSFFSYLKKPIKLNIDSNNKNLINYKNGLILGKTDTNKEIFDVICVSQFNLEKVTIPSFIKKINSCAFLRCKNLRIIDIQTNSELQSIGDMAFGFTNITSIFLPSLLIQVHEDFLNDFTELQIIEIGQNSKLNFNKIGDFDGIVMVPVKSTK